MSEVHLVVAIATYRRPGMLSRLLDSVDQAIDRVRTAVVSVVVVDNDPEQSARSVCEARDQATVSYISQPIPGISQTRNVAVAAATHAEFIVFVDDDEWVAEEWLEELLAVQRSTDADLVAGPVHSVLSADVDPAVRRSQLFARPDHADGSSLLEAGSGNLLCKMAVFLQRPRAEWFSDAYGLSGGGDAELTRRLHAEGVSIVWAANAHTWEEVPAERASFRWLAKRYRRVGAIDFRLGSTSMLRGVVAGSARVLTGALLLCWSFLTRGEVNPAAFRRFFRGIGFLEASFGRGFVEYRRASQKKQA